MHLFFGQQLHSVTAKQFKTVGPKSFDKQTMQHTNLHKSSIRSISVTFTAFRKTNGKGSLHSCFKALTNRPVRP